jgi:hypothetical protein
MSNHPAVARASAFCEALNIRVPILMAPRAGACPASLAVAVANAGGLGGCGALLMQPGAIKVWASDVRAGSNGGFQLNLWIPDPTPKRDMAARMLFGDFYAIGGQRSHARPVMPHCRTLPRNVKPCRRPGRRSYHQLWGFIRITSWHE